MEASSKMMEQRYRGVEQLNPEDPYHPSIVASWSVAAMEPKCQSDAVQCIYVMLEL